MESAGGKRQRGKQRGRQRETGLEEREEKMEENGESEGGGVGREMQQDLLSSPGRSFFLSCGLLTLSPGLATFLSGPQTGFELFSGWVWQLQVISFLLGTVSGGALQLRILTSLPS